MIHIPVLKLGDGAEWFMPRSVDDGGGVTSYYRRAFATTTVATSDLVSAVADEEGVNTVDDVLAVLRGGFDDEVGNLSSGTECVRAHLRTRAKTNM